MDLIRIAAVATAGLGLAWGANQLWTGSSGGSPLVLSQAPQAGASAEEDAPGGGSGIEDLDEEALQEELDRITRAAESGGDALEEFEPSKPLAADLPIELPSDI